MLTVSFLFKKHKFLTTNVVIKNKARKYTRVHNNGRVFMTTDVNENETKNHTPIHANYF